MRILTLLAMALILAPAASAETVGIITPYGRALIHAAIVDDDVRMETSASWVGLEMQAGDDIQAIGKVEWGISLTRGDALDLGAATGGGLQKVEESEFDPFGLRHGYVGGRFGRWGQVTLGKQNGPHYDIAGMTTDRLNVFGGEGTVAYPAGTDGGGGTARVNDALVYRVDLFDRLAATGMVQFSDDPEGMAADGFGFSARVRLGHEFHVGAAWTQRNNADVEQASITNFGDTSDYFAAGATYDSEKLKLGAVFSSHTSGDLVRVPDENEPDIAFDAIGFEIFSRLEFEGFSGLAALVWYDPDTVYDPADPDTPLFSDEFATGYLALGFEWHLSSSSYLYAEGKIDASEDVAGEDGSSALAIGFRYGFSTQVQHELY